jgi:glycosyltransferase involved in cell wall biosynthesis
VIPCLNEAENIEECVHRAHTLAANRITGEVIVVDNDSDDDSGALAQAAGAHVVHEPERGVRSMCEHVFV